MAGAARRQMADPGHQDLAAMHARVLAMIEAATEKLEADPCARRAVNELIDCAQGLAEVRRLYEAAAAQEFLAGTFIEMGRELERAGRPSSVAAPRAAVPPRARLRVVRAVGIGAGLSWAAAKAALKTHPAAAAGGVTVVALASAVTLSGAQWRTAPDITPLAPAPAATVEQAVPLPALSRAATPRTAAGQAVTGKGTRVTVAGPVPPPASTASPAGAGSLSVPGVLTLGAAHVGELVITAAGAPVTWSVSASDHGVGLSEQSGTLAAGQSEVIEVRVNRVLTLTAASTEITVSSAQGTQEVTVTWPGPGQVAPPS